MTVSKRSRSELPSRASDAGRCTADDRLEAHDDVVLARDAALRLLARREHSTDELRRKLKQRGYGDMVITEVVMSLHDANSVSDARFVESFVRVRTQRGQGPLRIRAELRERGVADNLIDEWLAAADEMWRGHAEKARAKRFGEGPPSSRDAWERQARFLAQRGYPADLIYRTLGPPRG